MLARILVTAALVLAGCSSSGGDAVAAGRAEAKAYTCPSSTRVARAANTALPTGRRVPFKDLSISCDYTSATLHGHSLIVTVTFGAGADDLETALQLLPKGGKIAKVAITGAQAYSVTDSDGSVTLFARSGDRLVSVVSDEALTGSGAIAVARVFF